MNNFEVQQIAKQTFKYLQANIRVGMHLPELRKIAEKKMTELGATSFWYWDVGAFIFSGGDTALSVSGRHYKTAEKVIAENDIITVDLSPQVGNVWDDFARTIIIENGKVTPATAVSIDETGGLVVKTADGVEKTLKSGEISVRW